MERKVIRVQDGNFSSFPFELFFFMLRERKIKKELIMNNSRNVIKVGGKKIRKNEKIEIKGMLRE